MLIALDADGVLVDYNEQMAAIASKVLNKTLAKVAHAHHFKNAYNVDFTKDERSLVFKAFAKEGWLGMPAVPGATEATQKLHNMGHTLVCLSSMPGDFAEHRLRNLQSHGMPIDKVIGSGRSNELGNLNPKAYHLEKLNPDIFVDDQLRNFMDIPRHICKIWINNNFHDCPNAGLDTRIADFTFSSLQEFVVELEKNPEVFTNFKRPAVPQKAPKN